MNLKRAVLALAALAVVYGAAAQFASPYLPRRIWWTVHYVEDVELLPTYASLAEEATFLVRSGSLPRGAAVSTGRVLAGLLLGTIAGALLGFTMAWASPAERLLNPWVTLLRYTPALGLLPLYVLWFGFGEASRVLLVATAVLPVVALGAYQGSRAVPRVYLEAATLLGAPDGMIFRRIIVPGALPHVFSSIRIALGLAWVTIVVAELIDPKMPSLGYLLTLASAFPRVQTIVVAIATIGGLVLSCDAAALACYHAATRWMKRRIER